MGILWSLILPAFCMGSEVFHAYTMLTMECDPWPWRDSVLPCDEPVVISPTSCAGNSLIASSRTVSNIGRHVLSVPGRVYTIDIYGIADVAPIHNPYFSSYNRGLFFPQISNYPVNYTIEIIFEIRDFDLPTSRYRLYDDGHVRVSLVYFTNDEAWCSTVRFLQLVDSDGTASFVMDFNWLRIQTGVTMSPDTPIHIFWSRRREFGDAVFCICDPFPGTGVHCISQEQDGGPTTLYPGSSFLNGTAMSLYTVYYSGLFKDELSEVQMQLLHTDLPHLRLHPPIQTAFVADERMIVTRALLA